MPNAGCTGRSGSLAESGAEIHGRLRARGIFASGLCPRLTRCSRIKPPSCSSLKGTRSPAGTQRRSHSLRGIQRHPAAWFLVCFGGARPAPRHTPPVASAPGSFGVLENVEELPGSETPGLPVAKATPPRRRLQAEQGNQSPFHAFPLFTLFTFLQRRPGAGKPKTYPVLVRRTDRPRREADFSDSVLAAASVFTKLRLRSGAWERWTLDEKGGGAHAGRRLLRSRLASDR